MFFQLSFVLVVKRRCIALLDGCTTTLAADGTLAVHGYTEGCYSVSAECVRASSVSVSSGMLVYDSQAVFYNLK